MKSTMFTGEQLRVESHDSHDRVAGVAVPTLSAYAIEYSEFTPPPHMDIGYRLLCQGVDFKVEGDRLFFTSPFSLAFGGVERCRLVVHYHGIRDYDLLFPQVTDPPLKARLGRFYEEAETAFDTRAWLSFALMASAVYEGLLVWRLGARDKTFSELIKQSLELGILSPPEAAVLDSARENRNLVHASRCAEEWVTRARAMDMRVVMDSLVRKLSLDLRGARVATRSSPIPS